MGIRPEFRWWILTLVVVGGLLGISALALNRPDVGWDAAKPLCPHCRTAVVFYSSRCAACGERYDWTVAPEDRSPLSEFTLSPLEAAFLQKRVATLGRDRASDVVAKELKLDVEAAGAYVDQVGSGRCGWCGGTGRDLAAPAEEEAEAGAEAVCPVCFGAGRCISCGRNRRIHVGDRAAHLAYQAWLSALADLSDDSIPPAEQREELARLNRIFLRSHAGTIEATKLVGWHDWPEEGANPAVVSARLRLDAVLAALAVEE